MSVIPRPALLLASLALCPLLPAQQGDRKGHDMTSFVPEDVIPPAPFLKPAEALESFELAPGFVLEAVATEPLVEMPVTLKFDGDGRMWVCEMVGYMPDIDGMGENIPQGQHRHPRGHRQRWGRRQAHRLPRQAPPSQQPSSSSEDGLLFGPTRSKLLLRQPRNGLTSRPVKA